MPGFDDQIGFTVVVLALAVLCAVIAALLMRRVAIRQANQLAVPKARWRWLPRLGRLGFRTPLPRLPAPSLDANPVLWREWHGNRARGWSRRIWAVYALASIAASALFLTAALINGRVDDDLVAVIGQIDPAVAAGEAAAQQDPVLALGYFEDIRVVFAHVHLPGGEHGRTRPAPAGPAS